MIKQHCTNAFRGGLLPSGWRVWWPEVGRGQEAGGGGGLKAARVMRAVNKSELKNHGVVFVISSGLSSPPSSFLS